jgi:hypothetical protein
MRRLGDPYRLLGIERGSSLEEIRSAYRRAALRCHPDTSGDHPAAAAREFYEVTEAYRACLRAHVASRPVGCSRDDARSAPQDYALRDAEWLSAALACVRAAEEGGGLPDLPRRRTRPTVNETKVFVCLWPLAIVVGLALSWATAGALAGDASARNHTSLFLGLQVLVYAAVVASILTGIVLSREIVWIARQIAGYCARRALPSGRRDRELSERPASGRWGSMPRV